MHNGYKDCVFSYRFLYLFRLDDAIGAWLKVSDLKTFSLEMTTSIEHSLVFNFRSNDVLASPFIKVRDALDR
jgi:hypothetical protein